MKKRRMSKEDIAFSLELMSEGVERKNVAKYVFGLSPDAFRKRNRE